MAAAGSTVLWAFLVPDPFGAAPATAFSMWRVIRPEQERSAATSRLLVPTPKPALLTLADYASIWERPMLY